MGGLVYRTFQHLCRQTATFCKHHMLNPLQRRLLHSATQTVDLWDPRMEERMVCGAKIQQIHDRSSKPSLKSTKLLSTTFNFNLTNEKWVSHSLTECTSVFVQLTRVQ